VRAVRISPVAAGSLDADAQVVRGGVYRTGLGAHRSPSDLRVNVRRHDSTRSLRQRSFPDDQISARRIGLLARLEKSDEGLRQRPFDPPSGPEQRRKRGHVNVVAAGVHEPVLGGEWRTRLLLDRQRVELCPHHDGLPRRTDTRHETSACNMLHAAGPESFRDEPGGSVLLMARLGDSVQPFAQVDGLRKLLFQGTE
jgi:hypothetical protein